MADKPKLTRVERKQIEAVIRKYRGDGKPHTAQDTIGVLGGSGTGCPEQRHCRFAVLGIANLTYIGAGFSHGSRCVAAILAMRVLAV